MRVSFAYKNFLIYYTNIFNEIFHVYYLSILEITIFISKFKGEEFMRWGHPYRNTLMCTELFILRFVIQSINYKMSIRVEIGCLCEKGMITPKISRNTLISSYSIHNSSLAVLYANPFLSFTKTPIRKEY